VKDSSGGFSNQQALLVILVCFPVGLIGFGLLIILLQRPITQIGQLPSSPNKHQTPLKPSDLTLPAPLPSGLNELQARKVVEEWLSVKHQIFASPFNTQLADQVVAEGPLWTDLTKADGSIDWLKKNNSYYSYDSILINGVSRFVPSPSMPSIVVSITENSTLHSPGDNKDSSTTDNWIYTLKNEGGRWKIWDYRKQ
jgi:hypothetical protein